MNQPGQTVAIVDWYWQGHHPTFFNQFILALEELRVDVVALCPSPEEAELAAEQNRKPAEEGSLRLGKTVFGKVTMALPRFMNLRPARIGVIDWTIRQFRGIEGQVKQLAAKSGRKVSAIFYACMYDFDFDWISAATPFLKIPWSGLYLHATSYRRPGVPHPGTGRVYNPEKMFGSRLCRAIGILDEAIVEQVSKSIGKPVVVLPDLTDGRFELEEEKHTITNRLKHFAAGRPIIGLFGHLQKSKGVLDFLEAAKQPEASGICFALGGEMAWSTFRDDLNQLQDLLAQCENLWTHLARIPDGDHMNSLLHSCDVLFASYRDFPHSSNIMTKAAVLRKPLIVSDGYLMADRVRRFRMGEVVAQGDSQALLEVALKIIKDPNGWIQGNQPQWEAYRREHSFERLKASLSSLLSHL